MCVHKVGETAWRQGFCGHLSWLWGRLRTSARRAARSLKQRLGSGTEANGLGVDTGDVCGEAPEPLRPQGDGGGVDLDMAHLAPCPRKSQWPLPMPCAGPRALPSPPLKAKLRSLSSQGSARDFPPEAPSVGEPCWTRRPRAPRHSPHRRPVEVCVEAALHPSRLGRDPTAEAVVVGSAAAAAAQGCDTSGACRSQPHHIPRRRSSAVNSHSSH
mmetsp:Transcript_26969/g.55972  ORF Transcript_26969/g.55972 Transcript_26969/m.55972 type:complete len:214 (-) Transcript_26969:636-1277(-)